MVEISVYENATFLLKISVRFVVDLMKLLLVCLGILFFMAFRALFGHSSIINITLML